MAITPIFRALITGRGRISFENRSDRAKLIRHLDSLRGKGVEITVRRVRSQRSLQANRYYFGVVVALLAEEFGYDKQEMHEVLAMNFLRIEDCPITGVPRRKHTPACDTVEFAEYVDACIRLGAEHGVIIPTPDAVEVGS